MKMWRDRDIGMCNGGRKIKYNVHDANIRWKSMRYPNLEWWLLIRMNKEYLMKGGFNAMTRDVRLTFADYYGSNEDTKRLKIIINDLK